MSRETYIQCPKCRYVSGDSWAQCEGVCPMPMSPDYTPAAALHYGPPRTVTAEEAFNQPVEKVEHDPDLIPF